MTENKICLYLSSTREAVLQGKKWILCPHGWAVGECISRPVEVWGEKTKTIFSLLFAAPAVFPRWITDSELFRRRYRLILGQGTPGEIAAELDLASLLKNQSIPEEIRKVLEEIDPWEALTNEIRRCRFTLWPVRRRMGLVVVAPNLPAAAAAEIFFLVAANVRVNLCAYCLKAVSKRGRCPSCKKKRKRLLDRFRQDKRRGKLLEAEHLHWKSRLDQEPVWKVEAAYNKTMKPRQKPRGKRKLLS